LLSELLAIRKVNRLSIKENYDKVMIAFFY
jgi:hypothetical protein